MKKKKNYLSPAMETIELEEKVAILSLSDGGSETPLKAVFDDDYEEEDASCAYSSEQNKFFDD